MRKHVRDKYLFPVHLSCSFCLRSVLAALSSRRIFLPIGFYCIHPSVKVTHFHQILFDTASEKPRDLNAICDLHDLHVVVNFVPSYVSYVTQNGKEKI